MAHSVRIKYYGVEGEGRNVTEAKRNAGAVIEKAMTGDYNLRYIVHHYATPSEHGNTEPQTIRAVVWRDPSGWSYRIIDAERDEEGATTPGGKVLYCDSNHQTAKDAITHCRRGVAQWIFTVKGNDGLDAIPPSDKEGRERHESWCKWQMRHHEARNAGLNDDQAREYANYHGMTLACYKKDHSNMSQPLADATADTPMETN